MKKTKFKLKNEGTNEQEDEKLNENLYGTQTKTEKDVATNSPPPPTYNEIAIYMTFG